MRTLRRRVTWTVIAALTAVAGYTAGFMMMPPHNTNVSLTVPQTPVELPVQPPVLDVADDA